MSTFVRIGREACVKLKSARIERGVTARTVARLAKIQEQAAYRIESGKNVNGRTLMLYVKALSKLTGKEIDIMHEAI